MLTALTAYGRKVMVAVHKVAVQQAATLFGRVDEGFECSLYLLPDARPEERFALLCLHLDAIRRESSLKKSIRGRIVDAFSHTRRLPAHMDELLTLCRENAFEP